MQQNHTVLTAASTTAAGPPTDPGSFYHLLVDLGVSPQTARTGQFLVLRPLEVVIILVVAYLAARLGARAVHKGLRRVAERAASRSGADTRRSARVRTVGSLAASLWRALVWVVAVLTIMGTIGINLTPIITGVAVLGAGLSFGAQSLVRDFLAGFFMVAEDQYGIGDTVTIGTNPATAVCGVVEDLSLRITRLRATDGRVWYVRNGEILGVGNASLQWSRALVDVVVPYGVEVERAVAAIADEASTMSAEPAWAPACLEPPEVWGVDAVDTAGVTVRLAVKTAVLQNVRIERALRARLTDRLVREGIVKPAAGA